MNETDRQVIYLANTPRLIRHLGALAKLAKVKAGPAAIENIPITEGWKRAGALYAYLTALGAAILDDSGTHHYTADMAYQAGSGWLQANEDLIDI